VHQERKGKTLKTLIRAIARVNWNVSSEEGKDAEKDKGRII